MKNSQEFHEVLLKALNGAFMILSEATDILLEEAETDILLEEVEDVEIWDDHPVDTLRDYARNIETTIWEYVRKEKLPLVFDKSQGKYVLMTLSYDKLSRVITG